ncbi:uncharacterized protein LOC132702294 isoform X2 [Cylas formicarius]|uniref:uncharacterized protein LOC132702294 isoform X2 n=1 Tax=Cylas formicarius TaxID=197179 RepID=UPI00295832FA|nr:uncharacterized protein LOC132702294 isoform X2 [Cylas formicarius]
MFHLMAVLLPLSFFGALAAKVTADYDNRTHDTGHSSDFHLEYVLLEDETHPCSRPCVRDQPPMICRYHFKVENYFTLTKACHDCPKKKSDCFRKDCVPGDGHSRGVCSVNRKIPGPAIEVCQGDLIEVDVENHLMNEGTTVHWHGQHQKDTPYMDGVPFVTQCPILPYTTFRYTFRAVNHGTHFWHSHLGMQRVDGCFGPMIVRVPAEDDPHDQFYDHDLNEHVMVLIDWEKETGLEKFLSHHHSIGDNKPATLLVNGFGRFKEFDGDDNVTIYTPVARFRVEQGYRYRFRVINAGFLNCPIELSVDNHTLKVISSDGNDFAPVEVQSLVTYAGERFDFVLSADQPKNLYWMRFRGLMDCDERFFRAHQLAVVEYNGFEVAEQVLDNDEYLPPGDPDYDNSKREGKVSLWKRSKEGATTVAVCPQQMNALNRGTEDNSTEFVSMPQLESLQKWDASLKTHPDYQFYIAYDFYNLNNHNFHRPGYEFYNVSPSTNQLQTPQFNHISMKVPSFPLLPQRDEVTEGMFCNEMTVKDQNCTTEYCECSHGYEIPLNSVVELVLIDEGFAYDANHPLHLHGYAFRVVAMERMGMNVTVDDVKKRDEAGLIKRNLLDAPLKDTVTVPDGGYTIVRFEANNPGYWIFHCHIEFHAEIGMALVLKVGENDEMLPVPPAFPKCGNYLPPEDAAGPPPAPPDCSRNLLIAKFQKYVFLKDCNEINSAATSSGFDGSLILASLLFATLH